MAAGVTPTQNDYDIARNALMLQFEVMFDPETREKMMALGMQSFINHVVANRAADAAYLRFYANCLHPNSAENS